MRRFRPRFTLRGLMVAVAGAALAMAVWAAWFDPVRRWRRAVNDDENGARRWEAVTEIASGKARVDLDTALATFAQALRSPSYRIRETDVAGLERLGSAARPVAPALIEALADPDTLIRGRVATALCSVLPPGDAGRDEAEPILKRMLNDPSSTVRLRAACTLAEFGRGRDGLPILLDALRQPNYFLRLDALRALGRIGPAAAPEALPVLKWLESEAATIAPTDVARFLRVYTPRTRCLLGDREAASATLRTLASSPDRELAREAGRIRSGLLSEGIVDDPASETASP